MARLRSELQPAHTKPSRWHAVLGPALAVFGILLLIGVALSA
jgi:hypothetical protein